MRRLGDDLMKTDKVTVLRDYHSVNSYGERRRAAIASA